MIPLNKNKSFNTVLPPTRRPANEASGWLGYYARRYLDLTFYLVDYDGSNLWYYKRKQGNVFRFIEEKPYGQQIHDSQISIFNDLDKVCKRVEGTIWLHCGVFIVYDVDKLGENPPRFPIRVSRWRYLAEPVTKDLDEKNFDLWLYGGMNEFFR